ncbi:hypothetical protein B0H10DRAFT_2207261 [Mycena sp. CBHHK59/15]|nr:hypothetical protein B0H10DRAFT_2207261 [Mycena sp. CBHHK59/15]
MTRPKTKAPADPPGNNVSAACRKKRGSPSDFQGKRLEFMTSQLDCYIAASKAKKKKTSEFWRPPDASEPLPEGAAWWDLPEESPEDAEAAFRALDLDLSEEEIAMKSEIQTKTKEKIKRWFNRQRPSQMGIYGNPYFEHLSRMRRQNDEPPPKWLADYQFYLQHPDYKGGVNEQFGEEGGDDLPRGKKLALRCDIAKRLLAAEPEEVRESLKAEVEEAHEQELQEYEDVEEGLPSVDPKVQQEARDKFPATVAPLMQALHAYTGYTICILASRVEGDTFDTISLNTGSVGGKDFSQWDPVGFATMLPTFLKFVHATHMASVGSEPGSSAPPLPVPVPAPAPPVDDELVQVPAPDTEMPPVAPAAMSEPGPPPPPPLLEDNTDIMSGIILGGPPTPMRAPTPAAAPVAAPTPTPTPALSPLPRPPPPLRPHNPRCRGSSV